MPAELRSRGGAVRATAGRCGWMRIGAGGGVKGYGDVGGEGGTEGCGRIRLCNEATLALASVTSAALRR